MTDSERGYLLANTPLPSPTQSAIIHTKHKGDNQWGCNKSAGFGTGACARQVCSMPSSSWRGRSIQPRTWHTAHCRHIGWYNGGCGSGASHLATAAAAWAGKSGGVSLRRGHNWCAYYWHWWTELTLYCSLALSSSLCNVFWLGRASARLAAGQCLSQLGSTGGAYYKYDDPQRYADG